DAEMTAGGLHRFHAVLQVRKSSPQHEGLQRNAILAAFGALKDLDLVIAVDDDIDIRNPYDVEYALATRMEASRDLFVIPDARGHEYIRAGDNGMRAKVGIDATVRIEERDRFRRCEFVEGVLDPAQLPADRAVIRKSLKSGRSSSHSSKAEAAALAMRPDTMTPIRRDAAAPRRWWDRAPPLPAVRRHA